MDNLETCLITHLCFEKCRVLLTPTEEQQDLIILLVKITFDFFFFFMLTVQKLFKSLVADNDDARHARYYHGDR